MHNLKFMLSLLLRIPGSLLTEPGTQEERTPVGAFSGDHKVVRISTSIRVH